MSSMMAFNCVVYSAALVTPAAGCMRAASDSYAAFGLPAWATSRLACIVLSIVLLMAFMFRATTCSTPLTVLPASALKVCICRSNRVFVALANCSGLVNMGCLLSG